MSNKASFAAEEWQVLRDTPHTVGMAVAMAGSSGLFGTVSEMFAAGKMIATTATGGNELLRALVERDELKASQEQLRTLAKTQDPTRLAEWVLNEAVTGCEKSLAILNAKGAPGDKDSYVKFLADMATNVANAATEGGFLGFGGERVSAKEREAIAAINHALNTGATGASV